MLSYVIRRVLTMVPVILSIIAMTFFLSHMVPADPVVAMAGDYATAETIAAIKQRLGLDQPVHIQFLMYLRNLSQGDLGVGITTKRPVATDIGRFLGATVELSIFAMVFAMAIGITLGVIAAHRKDGFADHFSRVIGLIGVSMPIFWLGLLLIALLYYKFPIFPAGGRISSALPLPPHITGLYLMDTLLIGDWKGFRSTLHHLILPAFTLGVSGAGLLLRITRSSMLEVLRLDYVRTARAKGLAERVVIFKHALKNAMLPVVTVIGLTFGAMLSGTVITETVFSRPGLGSYAVSSVLAIDFPAVMGVTLVIAIIYAVSNLLVDLTYSWLNPRIRYS